MKKFEKINIIKEMLDDVNFSSDLDNLINKYINNYVIICVINLNTDDLSFRYEKKIQQPNTTLNKIVNGPFFSWEYNYLASEKIDIEKIKKDMIVHEYNFMLNKVTEAKEDYKDIKKNFEHKFKKQIRIEKINNII